MASPFKGMDDRFNENMRKLYDRYSTKDGSQENPLLEIKPYDPNRNETEHDTFMLPIGSTKRDVERMTKFMKTGTGLLFLLKQEVGQSGNTFSQTRIINPFFVIENAVPFIHGERSLGKPTSFEVGHLQQHTADAAVARVMGTQQGISSIMSLFSGTSLAELFRGVMNVFKVGVAYDRPELNVGGNLYAVQLWKGGYQKHVSLSTNLDDAKNALRSGNIQGAYASLKNAVSTIKDGISSFGGILDDRLSLLGPRTTTSSEMDGRRYFITGPDTADTYLTTDTSFLHRQPYLLDTDPGMPDSTFPTAKSVNTTATGAQKLLTAKDIESIVNTSLNLSGLPTTTSVFTNSAIAGLVGATFAQFLNNSPDATSHLRFATLALVNRYQNDERLSFVRGALASHLADTKQYWDKHKSTTGFIINGLNPGDPVVNDPKVRTRKRYIHDKINDLVSLHNAELNVTPDTIKKIDGNAKDLVRVHFFDFVNKKVVPFRAFISEINETVVPEFQDTRYVGRIERNVVYVGVNRELSFTLHVQAFSDSEMEAVWGKINYVTGLCYPATYDHGYMVPPFVKLTIGDYYRDQPGYIRSLTHTIDDNTSWEITDGHQVPFGVTMHVVFSVIEKGRSATGTVFYPYGK